MTVQTNIVIGWNEEEFDSPYLSSQWPWEDGKGKPPQEHI